MAVNWVTLVDPTPDELAQRGAGFWSECGRCGGRDRVALPADLSEALAAMREILEAHRDCLAPLALSEDRTAEQLAADGDAPARGEG